MTKEKNMADVKQEETMTCDCGGQAFKYLMNEEVMVCLRESCGMRFLW